MKLDLTKLPVFLVSPGTGKYEERVGEVFRRLVKAGFHTITFVRSTPDPNPTDSLTKTVIQILEAQAGHGVPFLIFEDDVQFEHIPSQIDIPEDADLLYLGVSKWVYPHSYETLGEGFHICENGQGHTTEVSDTLVRLKGTTSTHGILYRGEAFKADAVEKLKERLAHHTPHDLIFATLHAKYNAYGLKEPLVYQDATLGGQELETRVRWNGGWYRNGYGDF
jgi:hypothetical protein